MANGRVITGFSKPYVALYNNTDGTNNFTKGQILARGVSVTTAFDSSDGENFYADNVIAESTGGTFTGGTVTLTVDGLLDEAESLLFGLPEPTQQQVGDTQVQIYNYGEGMVIPYVGIGFIIRYMSAGVTSYVPMVMPKVKFKNHEDSAATQQESIDFQTEELTATVYRDDTASKNWKMRGVAQNTEAEAENVIRAIFGLEAINGSPAA